MSSSHACVCVPDLDADCAIGDEGVGGRDSLLDPDDSLSDASAGLCIDACLSTRLLSKGY